MPDKRFYFYFYLIGRREDDSDIHVDMEPLANQVLSGRPVHDVATEAAKRALSQLEIDGSKSRWVRDNSEEIVEAGGSESLAWDRYFGGRLESLAQDLENGVLGEMEDILDSIEDGDDEGSEDDDPEDEEEDEDDPEDDDEDDEPSDEEDEQVGRVRVGKPLSRHARYDQWEARGRKDCEDGGDLGQVVTSADQWPVTTEMKPKAFTVAAANIVEQFWAKTGRRIRRDWRAAHLKDVEADGLRPAKAYNRWMAGWRELAYERAEESLKARQGRAA